jgi:beta-fructofuranosidase
LCRAKGATHWGHARSRDLVHWQHLPIALAPASSLGEEHCYSGGAIATEDGKVVAFYTSVPPEGRPFRQLRMVAADGDLLAWRRGDAVAASGLDLPELGHDARDPYLFRYGGKIHLVYGGLRGNEAVMPWFTADDPGLSRWRPRGNLLRLPKDQLPFPECPNFFPVGDLWLLLCSPYGPVTFRLGRFDGESFAVERVGLMDLGDRFYATNTWQDQDGRTVLTGWIRGFSKGRRWNGCLSFPRLIDPDARDGVRQRVHPAVAALRAGPPSRWSGRTNGVEVLDAEAGDAAEVRCHLRVQPGSAAELRFGAGEGVHPVVLRWDGTALELEGERHALATGDSLELHVLWDRSVLEIFADEGRTLLTTVAHRDRRGPRLELAAIGGAVEAETETWRLASCRREPWTAAVTG